MQFKLFSIAATGNNESEEESSQSFRRRVIESIEGSCPKEARTA